MIQNKFISELLHRYLPSLKVSSLAVALGIAGGLLSFCGRADAVETVKLVYETDDAVVSFDDIRAFAETGQPPTQIEQFLLDNGQPAEVISRLLTEEITLSENLRERLRSRLDDSSIGQFVLYQIDKVVQSSGDITALKNALDRTMEDRTISVLELLENYTDADQVTVNLVGLRQTYTDVKAFVERVIPALEVAKGYLQDVVCDCDTPQQAATSASPQSQLQMDQAVPVATTPTVPCLNHTATTQSASNVQPDNTQVPFLNQSNQLSSSNSHFPQR